MTQLWVTGLTRSGEQLQPQAKLWTASPQAGEDAVTRFTWKKGSVIKKKKNLSVQGLLPRHYSRAWLAGVPLPHNKSCGCRWGASPSLCSHVVCQEPPGVSEDRAGTPLPRGSTPLLFCSLHSPRAYRVSLPLEFPLPCFFLISL